MLKNKLLFVLHSLKEDLHLIKIHGGKKKLAICVFGLKLIANPKCTEQTHKTKEKWYIRHIMSFVKKKKIKMNNISIKIMNV